MQRGRLQLIIHITWLSEHCSGYPNLSNYTALPCPAQKWRSPITLITFSAQKSSFREMAENAIKVSLVMHVNLRRSSFVIIYFLFYICTVLLFGIISIFKIQESIFMLLMTVVCLCFQCAHAISGRSSSQPFRGMSHKSTVSSRSSSLKCFTRHLIRSTTATSRSFPILHKPSLFIYFFTPGHLKPAVPLNSNHLRCK